MKLINLPSFIITAVTAVILSMPCYTHADTIVDTGPGLPGSTGGSTLANLESLSQNLAVEFTLIDATNITSVEGWLSEAIYSAGSLTIAIGTSPGEMLFSGTYQSQELTGLNQWTGLIGLNWFLESGTYWLSFIANPGFFGVLPGGAAQPLSKFAFAASSSSSVWYVGNTSEQIPGSADWGIRIMGEPQRVPDNGATITMIAGALVGFAVLRRRFVR